MGFTMSSCFAFLIITLDQPFVLKGGQSLLLSIHVIVEAA